MASREPCREQSAPVVYTLTLQGLGSAQHLYGGSELAQRLAYVSESRSCRTWRVSMAGAKGFWRNAVAGPSGPCKSIRFSV
jgi:hypothetical protein